MFENALSFVLSWHFGNLMAKWQLILPGFCEHGNELSGSIKAWDFLR
jgi:hypothetical protein